MFTGIIEEVGTVAELKTGAAGGRIRIACSKMLPKLQVSSSIAVSGCCLTVVERDEHSFFCDLAPETLTRTGFRRLTVGARLNLESCLTLEKSLDGHIVQGHVDGTGSLAGLTTAGDDHSTSLPRQAGSGQGNWWLDIDVPQNLVRYLVQKGSVAVEGISLTVASIEGTRMRIAIIPFTYRETNLAALEPGDPVNLECDVLAKYLEKLVQAQAQPPQRTERRRVSRITLERLRNEGF